MCKSFFSFIFNFTFLIFNCTEGALWITVNIRTNCETTAAKKDAYWCQRLIFYKISDSQANLKPSSFIKPVGLFGDGTSIKLECRGKELIIIFAWFLTNIHLTYWRKILNDNHFQWIEWANLKKNLKLFPGRRAYICLKIKAKK